MSKRIAVIGAGLTGTSFLWQLASRLEGSKPQEASIDIFERHADPGPGLPHNPLYGLPCHITNMCSLNMGIVAGYPGGAAKAPPSFTIPNRTASAWCQVWPVTS